MTNKVRRKTNSHSKYNFFGEIVRTDTEEVHEAADEGKWPKFKQSCNFRKESSRITSTPSAQL